MIIPNWTDIAAIIPIPLQNNELRHEWDLDEHFVVAYSGNMGIALEFVATIDAAEIHPVSLHLFMEGLILPSKFYGIAAKARPTVFIGNTCGEMATLLKEQSCGSSVEHSDSRGLANLTFDYVNDPQRCQLEGERARQLAD